MTAADLLLVAVARPLGLLLAGAAVAEALRRWGAR